MPAIRAAAEDLDSESDPALMRFVELIHLCSAVSSSLELCCVDEAGSELMRGQVGRTRSAGLSPCPPVPSVFPPVFGCRTLSRASGLAGKGNARGRAGLWGLRGSGFVSAGIWVGVRERRRGCRGWDGRAEPFGDRLLEVSGRFRGLPCPSAQFQGERLLCLGAGTQGKLSRVKVCEVSGAVGASDPRSPPGLFSRSDGCPCKGGAREGGFPEEKARRTWGVQGGLG